MALYFLFFHVLALVREYSVWCVLLFALLWLPLVWYVYRHPVSPRGQRLFGIAVIIAAALVVCAVELGSVRYAASNVLSDHVESNVISLSDVWGTQHPLYGSLADPERYSLLYGPNLFIVSRLSMNLLGASIQSAKLPEALLVGLSIVLLFFIYRAESSSPIALVCLAYCLLAIETLSAIWPSSLFWARGEPYIVFSAVVALFAARMKNAVLATALLGVAMGFAVNIKLHSLIFLLPTAVLFARQRGYFRLIVSLVIAAVVAALPFGVPGISLANYFVWLHVAGAHPLIHGMLLRYAKAGIIVVLPVAAIYRMAWVRQPDVAKSYLRENAPFFATCVAAVGINIIPAMKLGSGGYHFIPFAPLLGFVLCQLLARFPRQWSPLLRTDLAPVALAAAAILVMTAKLLVDERELNELSRDGGAWATRVIDEIKGIESNHPGKTIAMGYGDTASYLNLPVTDYRTQVVFDHQAYPLDAVSVMDTQLAGKPLAPATIGYLKSGLVRIWLIPRGSEPFSMVRVGAAESSAKIFDAEFRQAFFENYRCTTSTPHFDLWEATAPASATSQTFSR
jgi:hypothetical protein